MAEVWRLLACGAAATVQTHTLAKRQMAPGIARAAARTRRSDIGARRRRSSGAARTPVRRGCVGTSGTFQAGAR
eukprot:363610-Chlamydomonas_euryale.AAC.5